MGAAIEVHVTVTVPAGGDPAFTAWLRDRGLALTHIELSQGVDVDWPNFALEYPLLAQGDAAAWQNRLFRALRFVP